MNHSKDPLHRGKPYISCDEYPYASTLESDGGNQVSRCVEIKEQRCMFYLKDDQLCVKTMKSWSCSTIDQGGRLRKLPAPSSGNPTIFTTDLQFTGGTKHKYCQPNPDCRNDGFQIQDGQVAADEKWLIQAFESSPTTSTNLKRNASPRGPRPRSYRTKSGIEILSVANYSIGQIYPRELLMDEKELEGFSYYMLDGEMFIDDEIVEMIEHTMPGNSVVDNAEIGNSTISNSTVSNLTVSNSTMSNSMMSNSTMSSSTLSTSTFSTSTMTNTTICDTTTGTSTMSGYN